MAEAWTNPHVSSSAGDVSTASASAASVSTASAGAAGCVHHWLLGEPEAGLIAGRCKRCGAVRSFPAMLEGADRFDDGREVFGAIGPQVRLVTHVAETSEG